MFDWGPFLTAGLYFSIVSYAAAIGLMGAQYCRRPRLGRCLVEGGWAGCLVLWGMAWGWGAAGPAFVGLGANLASELGLRDFTPPGRRFVAALGLLGVFGCGWGIWFAATVGVSPVTRGLMGLGCPLLLLAAAVGLTHGFETAEVLCRQTWHRPRTPLPPQPRRPCPKVSLHVPVHAEPPPIVCATLDALARLAYPNFEVLVVDNNTPDPRLWKPVASYCQQLGDRFRFFHVEGLTGAKAGALNFALAHTAGDAELVGVVDSDYQVHSDFLARTVGYFDDPQMGWVQARHAYRDWQGSPYQRMCHWEYRQFFATTLVSRNERDGALTVGTLCLIRRQALEAAGGWAQWCLTEDSELAPRIHALGYTSVYLNATFGRGLIPETFAGYRRQRFRWTYGPVQQFKRHWRLFLPPPCHRPSALSPAQKFHHLTHGLEHLIPGLGLLFLPLAVAVAGSMVWQQEIVRVPPVLWFGTVAAAIAQPLLALLTYRVAVKCSLWEGLGAMVAAAALVPTQVMASFWALFTATIPWRRTNKFKSRPSGLGVLSSLGGEFFCGLTPPFLAAVAVALLPQSELFRWGLVLSIPCSFCPLAAAALALLAEQYLDRTGQSNWS